MKRLLRTGANDAVRAPARTLGATAFAQQRPNQAREAAARLATPSPQAAARRAGKSCTSLFKRMRQPLSARAQARRPWATRPARRRAQEAAG
jgi:hypothetical protein